MRRSERQKIMRVRALVAPLLAGALVLAACGNGDDGTAASDPEGAAASAPEVDDDGPEGPEADWVRANAPELLDIVEDACNEGSVSFYIPTYGSELQTVINTFEDTFPCLSVEALAGSGGAMAERYASEGRAGNMGADIFMQNSVGAIEAFSEEGLVSDFVPPTSGDIPDEWKNDGVWYGAGLYHLGIAWNTANVSDEQLAWIESVETWDDVPDGPFSPGEVGWVHVRAGGTSHIPFYYWMEEHGLDYWQDIEDTYEPFDYDGVALWSERIAAGEVTFAPHAHTDTALQDRWTEGAPVQWKFPDPGLAGPALLNMSEDGPNPNAAMLFLTWSLTPDALALYVEDSGLAPITPEVADNRPIAGESWYELPSTYFEYSWDDVDEAVPTLAEEYEQIFE